IEMKMRQRSSVLGVRAHAVGVAAQHKAREQSDAVVAVADLFDRRPAIWKLQRFALIRDTNIEVELVEARLECDRSAAPATFFHGFEQLQRREGCALDHI